MSYTEDHVGVSLAAWFIQKALGNRIGRLDWGGGGNFSRTPSLFDIVLKESIYLLMTPSPVCLALTWVPPGRGTLGMGQPLPHTPQPSHFT